MNNADLTNSFNILTLIERGLDETMATRVADQWQKKCAELASCNQHLDAAYEAAGLSKSSSKPLAYHIMELLNAPAQCALDGDEMDDFIRAVLADNNPRSDEPYATVAKWIRLIRLAYPIPEKASTVTSTDLGGAK